MSNVSPKCGICAKVSKLDSGSDKEEILDILQGDLASEQAVALLEPKGFKASASSLRRHRREHHVEEASVASEAQTVQPPLKLEKPPAGWEPYSEYTETVGSAIVRIPKPGSTHRDLLVTAGFDPDEWQISGKVNTRKWMRYDQEWLYYYKFDVVAGESPEVVEEHIEDLIARIRATDRQPAQIETGGHDTFVFAASDWQIGKREGEDGTPQTIERVLSSVDLAVARIHELRSQGRRMPYLLFAGLGDLGEGTCGFYPGQQFLIDRTRRQQGQINRELLTTALDKLSPLFEKTVVAAVGGNHGENRNPDGQRITSDGDNDDCAYFDAVRESFDRAGGHNIEWHIMEDELSMALELGGVEIGMTHGHLFQRGKGSTVQQKAYEWWKGQDFGMHAVRGTQVLLSAHFHHFSATTYGMRTHMQTPPMDPGSKWYRETRGEDSPAGTLTFRLDADVPLGWDDLMILQP